MIPVLIIFIITNIVLAFIDAHKIIKSRTVNHTLNALVYLGFLSIPFYLFKDYWMIGALLFVRLTVFNIALSLFRGKKWDYISPMPAAVTDRIAGKIFGNNGKLMYVVYSILLISLIVISLWTKSTAH